MEYISENIYMYYIRARTKSNRIMSYPIGHNLDLKWIMGLKSQIHILLITPELKSEYIWTHITLSYTGRKIIKGKYS